ncbi:MAG TPA: hypothetical protein VLI04_03285 [Nocardioidaceae bacterium]|nr:hypothetical protein [Nocardioidaceae bacterium]
MTTSDKQNHWALKLLVILMAAATAVFALGLVAFVLSGGPLAGE